MIERGKFADICPGVCGRVLALVLLTLALLNPGLPWGQAAVDLVLLLDDSASMPRSDSNQAWREVLTRARDLPPGSRFSLLRFAAVQIVIAFGQMIGRIRTLSPVAGAAPGPGAADERDGFRTSPGACHRPAQPRSHPGDRHRLGRPSDQR